ncbi:hypothetical protein LCGC14_3102630, partial [marine sediment metagenome]
FGLVRWLATTVERERVIPTSGAIHFTGVSLDVLVGVLFSIPFAIGLTESLIWMSVWIMRRRWFRRLRGKKN